MSGATARGCASWKPRCAARSHHYGLSSVSALRLEPHHRPTQIIGLGALDLHRCEFADPQRAARGDVDGAVDLRRVALAAALGGGGADFVDQHLLAGADLAPQAPRRDRLLALHEAVPALL